MERRKRARQDLQLPLAIVEVNGLKTQWSGVTRNVSSGGGICFWSDVSIPVGSKVRYIVTLAQNFPPVKISCGGVVVRCIAKTVAPPAGSTQTIPAESRPFEAARDHAGHFEIAMTMSRYRFLSDSESESPTEFAPIPPAVPAPLAL